MQAWVPPVSVGLRKTVLVILATLWVCLFARRSDARPSARPTGLSTEIALDREGAATITLKIRWRVQAGRLRQFELNDMPQDLTILEATGVDGQGNAVPVTAKVATPGHLEVSVGEQGGIRQGTVDVLLRYTSSLRAQGAIRREGPDAVVSFTTTPWEWGLEATEMTFELPSALRRAQWIPDDTPGLEVEAHSDRTHDTVHISRRHLPAGAAWNVRIAMDPSVFTWLDGPRAVASLGAVHKPRSRTLFGVFATVFGLVLVGASLVLQNNVRRWKLEPWLPTSIIRVASPLLVAVGALVQALSISHRSTATLGLSLTVIGFVLVIPRRASAVATSQGAWTTLDRKRSHRLFHDDVRKPARRSVGALTLAASVLCVIALLVTSSFGSLIGLLCAINATVLVAVFAVCARTMQPPRESWLLFPVVESWRRASSHSRATDVSWRVRGNGEGVDGVRARLSPQSQHTWMRGLRHIEWAVQWEQGLLVGRGVVVVRAYCESGSRAEKTIRTVGATYGGSVVDEPESSTLVLELRADGPFERDARAALDALLTHAMHKDGDTRSKSPSLHRSREATSANSASV